MLRRFKYKKHAKLFCFIEELIYVFAFREELTCIFAFNSREELNHFWAISLLLTRGKNSAIYFF